MKIELARARKWAEKIKEELTPYCARIEIVGSIRREREYVGDLDFVVLPAAGNTQLVKERCSKNAAEIRLNGEQNFVFVVGDIQIDIFFARATVLELFGSQPGNWGTLMLSRTGSKQFNVWLASQAKARGMHWDPYNGVWGTDGRMIPCEDSEQDVFKAIGVEWVEPNRREW